jgi:hypothetical protein
MTQALVVACNGRESKDLLRTLEGSLTAVGLETTRASCLFTDVRVETAKSER